MISALTALALILLLIPSALCEEALPDGTYVPDSFSFTGGTGRVTITCPGITVSGGDVIATIVFSSTHYTVVRLDGEEYTPEYTEDSSIFELPVKLNTEFSIFATTTAMSAPHEIEYRLFIGMGEGGIGGLASTDEMALGYAEGFSVEYYEGGYALIDVTGHERYLVVPEGQNVPEGLDPEICVLQKPFGNIYLAATSAMALFDSIGALDSIRLSGTQADGWYDSNAAQAMENGDILFAGKYSEPDFELLLTEKCDLCVESMMILHAPNVKELIELLGIPVFIDRSSSEPHPLGRLEWIKLYGLLTGKENEADEVFARQEALVNGVETSGTDEKKVAFFALKPDGTVTVRGSGDYIVKCIEIAGGSYVFSSIEGQETNASVNITMEAFYEAALDADVLIYNSTIETPVATVDELVSQQPLLADFRAVKEGNVYCTEKFLYQATDGIGVFITDLQKAISGEEDTTFIYKLR